MKTQVLNCDEKGIEAASELLKNDEVVAIPTETVYGLAANALSEKAVEKIFAVKGRPQDNPLIVHIAEISMWEGLVKNITPDALKLAKAFWPGPLTIILPKSDIVPNKTSGGLDTVGVRMPSHLGARAIIKKSGVPIAAPSANLSGLPSTTSVEHCIKDLSGKIPLIINGGDCFVGIESTVISLVDEPMIMRPGSISANMIKEALGKEVLIAPWVADKLAPNEKPLSPGAKYKHYSPKARLVIVKATQEQFFKFLNSKTEKNCFGLIFNGEEKLCQKPYICCGDYNDSKTQAKELFRALRLLDEKGATLVYIRAPKEGEEFLGVYNRLIRAASFEVLTL